MSLEKRNLKIELQIEFESKEKTQGDVIANLANSLQDFLDNIGMWNSIYVCRDDKGYTLPIIITLTREGVDRTPLVLDLSKVE